MFNLEKWLMFIQHVNRWIPFINELNFVFKFIMKRLKPYIIHRKKIYTKQWLILISLKANIFNLEGCYINFNNWIQLRNIVHINLCWKYAQIFIAFITSTMNFFIVIFALWFCRLWICTTWSKQYIWQMIHLHWLLLNQIIILVIKILLTIFHVYVE